MRFQERLPRNTQVECFNCSRRANFTVSFDAPVAGLKACTWCLNDLEAPRVRG